MKSKFVTQYGKDRLCKGLTLCAEFWNVPKELILTTSRSRRIMNARHSIRYYLCMGNDLNLCEIGTLTNGDHTSVIHSRKAFEQYCEYEEDFRALKRMMKGEVAHLTEVKERKDVSEILKLETTNKSKANLIIAYYGNK